MWDLLLGGAGLLGGLLSDILGGNSNTKDYYGEAKNFLNPNSPIYSQAARGFYNRLNDASPSLNSLLGFAKSQGIGGQGSMAIARAQKDSVMSKIGEAANNFQSDLFSRGWQTGNSLMNLDFEQSQGKRNMWQDMGNNMLVLGGSMLDRYFRSMEGQKVNPWEKAGSEYIMNNWPLFGTMR